MSSEVHNYIEKSLKKKENLFNAEVINFPNEKSNDDFKDFKVKNENFWKISDKSNNDQLRAVIGICFMFGALIVMGLYSNFL
tara:strand:- start:1612 stop:1857 length:246 start_codon:yes stop_codon:yes gene_type:complete